MMRHVCVCTVMYAGIEVCMHIDGKGAPWRGLYIFLVTTNSVRRSLTHVVAEQDCDRKMGSGGLLCVLRYLGS